MSTDAMHAAQGTPTAKMAWCACGQGFSGHEADVRLAHHVAKPDPNGIGALLIDVFGQPVD